MKLGFKIAAIAGALILSVSACGNKQQQVYNDAPRTGVNDTTAADIISMPDGFSNVASKCYKGYRVFVIFHNDNNYGSIAVVKDDNCA